MTKQYHSVQDQQKVTVGFSTDNKYSRRREEEIAQLEKEIEEAEKLENQEGEGEVISATPDKEEKVGDPNKGKEESQKASSESDTDWKKRYGDLRSHLSKREQELQDQINTLSSKVDAQEKSSMFPETIDKDELQDWLGQYPQVAKAMQTLILENTEGLSKELKETLNEVRKGQAQNAYEKAYNSLLKKHPDFDEIRVTETFKEWLEDQPKSISDAINSPSLDDDGVKAASRVVDFFKKETGLSQKKDTPDPAGAAKKVSSGETPKPSQNSGKVTYSESQVEVMTDREYAKHADAIELAQSEGRFEYDISAAR